MNKPIFSITNSQCKYTENGNAVLDIQELNINRGKMIFITGASGTGKSTILESLGLMNNTLFKLPIQAKFLFQPSNDEIDYSKIWSKSDHELSKIRNDYFAFIFQSSNLIPYISIYENLSLLLEMKGVPFAEHDEKIQNILEAVHLKKEINQQAFPSAISGGQRQRVAIARALLSNPEIVFGDEPTGSLDRPNARKIFQIFKDLCSQKQTTAIIVSHDIDLTIEFADEIIIIDKCINDVTQNTYYGSINQNCHYKRNNLNNWINRFDEPIDMSELLLRKIKGVNEN